MGTNRNNRKKSSGISVLRQRRLYLGLKLSAVVSRLRRLGLRKYPSYLSAIERGDYYPRPYDLHRVLRAYGLDPTDPTVVQRYFPGFEERYAHICRSWSRARRRQVARA